MQDICFSRQRLKTSQVCGLQKHLDGISHQSVTAFVARGSKATRERLFNRGYHHRIHETKSQVCG